MLFYFWKGINAGQTAKKIGAVYGNCTIDQCTVRKLFTRSKINTFDVDDRVHSEGIESLIMKLKCLLKITPVTERDIAEILHIFYTSV